MPHARAALLAIASLILTALLGIMPVTAHASILRQCNPDGYCLNQWGAGFLTKAYQGDTANDAISLVYVGNGIYEFIDNINGGCLGDNSNNQGDAKVGAGNLCPSVSSNPGWGTRYEKVSGNGCPPGYASWWNVHWLGYLGFNESNGAQAYQNTQGNTCLQQLSG